MLSIAQCVNNMDLGGLEQLVLTLSCQFHKRGHRSLIICIEDPGGLAARAESNGVHVHALQCEQRGKWTAFREFCRILHQHRPIVLHSHNFKPFYYSALATCRGAANAHIHTRHGSLLQAHRALWRYRALRRWVDYWVTVSADRRTELAMRTGLPEEQIRIVTNGVDTSRFQPPLDKRASRLTLGVAPNVQVIVTVARLAPEKDFSTLLHAFAQVHMRLPATELWFVGDGPERLCLEQLAHKLNISDCVRFWGIHMDTEKYLQAADVFVLSSLSEGLSIALVEASACGLPLIATNVGGNPEIVRTPEMGHLVPPCDPSPMAAAILNILGNELQRTAMGQAARRSALKNFTEEHMLDTYWQLYKDALNARSPKWEHRSPVS